MSYPGRLRANQAYLTKMPLEFVERFRKLAHLASALDAQQEELAMLSDTFPAYQMGKGKSLPPEFRPKTDEEYAAFISGGVQRRSRNHERLVRLAGEEFQKNKAVVTNPHPLDLLVTVPPLKVIIEAKLIGGRNPGFAIREAVGQLFEYRYFKRLHDSEVCILLDGHPGEPLVRYVESALGMLILWLTPSGLIGGSETARKLAHIGVRSNGAQK
jgi:hypothetical protein